jgi:exodeoxyribonuclease-5
LLQWLDGGCFGAPPRAVVARWPVVGEWWIYGLDIDQHEALRRLGIRFADWVQGWEPKPRCPGAILVIDEASMLGAKLLALARAVYDTVVLVGDRRQLAPVNDAPALHVLAPEHVAALTTVHQQAWQSPVLDIAERAWQTGRLVAPTGHYGPADAAQGTPLVVWRNETRKRYTREIRAALGLPSARIARGEPVVCRSKRPADRARGLHNNSAWTVVDTDGKRAELLDPNGETVQVARIAMEEFGSAAGTPFRFGYALTAHAAQGGEWPHVVVDAKDAAAHAAARLPDEARRWAYTAATRAAQSLRLVAGVEY